MFAGNLGPNDVVDSNYLWTFSWGSGAIFNFKDDSDILQQLQDLMSNYGNVLSANRALFSGSYTITVQPNDDYYLKDWISAFQYSFQQMGFPGAYFRAVDQGTESSKPGGLAGAAKSAADAEKNALHALSTEILVPIAIIAVVAGVIYFLPQTRQQSKEVVPV